MRALIRKVFPYGGREMNVGAVEEIDDAAFAKYKRDRLVTEAPEPPEVVLAPVASPAAIPVARKSTAAPVRK